MGRSVLDTFLQHLTWSLGGGWNSLFSLLQVACSQIRQVGSLCGESEGKRRSHFTCSQHWCLFTSSSRWGRSSCRVFPGLPEQPSSAPNRSAGNGASGAGRWSHLVAAPCIAVCETAEISWKHPIEKHVSSSLYVIVLLIRLVFPLWKTRLRRSKHFVFVKQCVPVQKKCLFLCQFSVKIYNYPPFMLCPCHGLSLPVKKEGFIPNSAFIYLIRWVWIKASLLLLPFIETTWIFFQRIKAPN